jgi:hypothetical protein
MDRKVELIGQVFNPLGRNNLGIRPDTRTTPET